MSEVYLHAEGTIPCVCDNCLAEHPANQLDAVVDLEERLDPGSIVPAGQCPECGGLSYYQDEEAPPYTSQAKLYQLEQRGEDEEAAWARDAAAAIARRKEFNGRTAKE